MRLLTGSGLDLIHGETLSQISNLLLMRKYKHDDLTGRRFFRLTILGGRKTTRTPGGWYVTTWRCRCDCGQERDIQTSNFRYGTTKRCGCWGPENTSRRMRKESGFAATTQVWGYYTANARRRGIDWHLDREQFTKLILDQCWYCGEFESMTATKHKDQIRHNGIDRVDPSRGYTPENCVTACKICNQAKADLTLQAFKDWLNRVKQKTQ